MKSFSEFLSETPIRPRIQLPPKPVESSTITQNDLHKLEQILDALFKTAGMDVEFTKHFFDRVNDARNMKQITWEELKAIFDEVYHNYAKTFIEAKPDLQAVITDLNTNINIPISLKWDRNSGLLEIITKTVMRKKGFLTGRDRIFKTYAQVKT